jgi:hypothetical protein
MPQDQRYTMNTTTATLAQTVKTSFSAKSLNAAKVVEQARSKDAYKTDVQASALAQTVLEYVAEFLAKQGIKIESTGLGIEMKEHGFYLTQTPLFRDKWVDGKKVKNEVSGFFMKEKKGVDEGSICFSKYDSALIHLDEKYTLKFRAHVKYMVLTELLRLRATSSEWTVLEVKAAARIKDLK